MSGNNICPLNKQSSITPAISKPIKPLRSSELEVFELSSRWRIYGSYIVRSLRCRTNDYTNPSRAPELSGKEE